MDVGAPVDICNLALSHLGVSVEIVDLDTERSKEAKACRRFYDVVRDEVLRDFDWPFAKVTELLALVEDFTGDSDRDWSFAYRYPADAIAIRRVILGGAGRLETQSSKVRYLMGRDNAGVLIYTDLADASVEFTYRETDVTRFPPDFISAFSHLLASRIGPRIAGDKIKLVEAQLPLYDYEIRKARANALNEQLPDFEPDSELLRARGYVDPDGAGSTNIRKRFI